MNGARSSPRPKILLSISRKRAAWFRISSRRSRARSTNSSNIEADDRLPAICALFKDRCDTLLALAHWAAAFYAGVTPDAEEKARHVTDAVRPALAQLAQLLETCEWTREAIGAAIKSVLAEQGLKMPQLAMPVRVLVRGSTSLRER